MQNREVEFQDSSRAFILACLCLRYVFLEEGFNFWTE
jgi:hypothetical protein